MIVCITVTFAILRGVPPPPHSFKAWGKWLGAAPYICAANALTDIGHMIAGFLPDRYDAC